MRVLTDLPIALRAAPALIALLPLVGCGGSADESRPFADRATALCREYAEQLDTGAAGDSEAEVGERLAERHRIEAERATALAALDPPPEVADAYGRALEAWDRRVAQLRRAVDAVAAGADPAVALDARSAALGQLAERATDASIAAEIDACADLARSSAGGNDGVALYLNRVNGASTALTELGAILDEAESTGALAARADRIDGEIAAFERSVRALEDLPLAVPRLERQRAAIVAAARPLSARLRRFSAAVRRRDNDAMRAQLADVTESLAAFRVAADEDA